MKAIVPSAISRGFFRFVATILLFALIVSVCIYVGGLRVQAASSPWTQTNWSGGSGQASWSDTTKFDSATSVNSATSGQLSLSSWGYRRKITFDNSAQSDSLVDFPVMIKLNSTRVDYGQTQNSGQDIRFTDADGTILPYEIEQWDESGESYVWVKVPQVDASSNTDFIYMYYGNSSASDAQDAASVWGVYDAVWHMKESGNGTLNEYADSTGNGYNGQGGNGSSTAVPTASPSGRIGPSQVFDGSNDFIGIPSETTQFSVNSFSYEFWVHPTSAADYFIMDNRDTNLDGPRMRLFSNRFDCNYNAVFLQSAATIPTNTWTRVGCTSDGSTLRLYVNGVPDNTAAVSGNISEVNNINIARNRFQNVKHFPGSIDEGRVSLTTLSASWMAASYKSEIDTFATYGSESSVTASVVNTGTLTSSIFDSGFTNGADWGVLAYNATTPANTSITMKVRTGDSSDLSDATSFISCDAVTSGSDISSNNCVDDSDRYVQYQVTLSNTDGTSTPTLEDVSLAFVQFDSTGPVLELESPGSNDYTNNVRPVFRWKKASDAASSIADYDLTIDNPSLGSSQLSGDFSISDIPARQGSGFETNKYVVKYENFDDSDSNNDFISVYTKSSSEWDKSNNDGELREGRVTWKVRANDTVGNSTEVSRTLFVDRSSPSVKFIQVNATAVTGSALATTDTTPTIFGTITDPLVGGDSSVTQTKEGPRVASGPQEVIVTVKKQRGAQYDLHTTYTYSIQEWFSACDNMRITDNGEQKCDKYAPFEYRSSNALTSGVYLVTATGKDRTGNTSGTAELTLRIGEASEISELTPLEPTIENEIVLPDDMQVESEPNEVTVPVESLESSNTAKENVQEADGSRGVLAGLTEGAPQWLRSFFSGIGKGFSSVGRAIASAVRATGNLAMSIGGGIKQSLSKTAIALGERVQGISDKAGLSIANFGYSLVDDPTTITNVHAEALSPTSVKITWETNQEANGKVNYGLDRNYTHDMQTEERTTHHEFVITELQPNTTYHFEVMSYGKNYVYDANREFRTPAE